MLEIPAVTDSQLNAMMYQTTLLVVQTSPKAFSFMICSSKKGLYSAPLHKLCQVEYSLQAIVCKRINTT